MSLFLLFNCRNHNTSNKEYLALDGTTTYDKFLTIKGITEVPQNTSKRIITRYYKPVKLNESYVIGEELKAIVPCNDTTYYDEYNNVLLSIEFIEDNSYLSIFRYNYFDPKEGKLQNYYEYLPNLRTRINKYDYIRNEKGLLTEIRGMNTFFEYDGLDNRTEEYQKSNNKKTIITTNTNSLHTIKNYKVINDTSKYVNKSIIGLEEEITEIIDKNTNLVISKETESFKGGTIHHIEVLKFAYDSKARVVQEELYRVGLPKYKKVAHNLSQKESENLLNAYNNSMHKTIQVKRITYDDYGNITSEVIESKSDASTEWQSEISTRNEYKYNKRGDWIENIYFIQLEEPTYIAVRDIKYYR